jgi:hypothetical protein
VNNPSSLTVAELFFEAPAETLLRGRDARRQLGLTARDPAGELRDVTRRAAFTVEPPGIAAVDEFGLVTPLEDGKVTVRAAVEGVEGAATAAIELTVEKFHEEVPVNFPNQVVPIFTKHGCNGGGCHGKSGGQNGFRLSLLGFYPEEDHEYLVKESMGRRISHASPDRSLLLLKATNTMPHGGGARIERDSYEYRLLKRWMIQGVPYGSAKDPTVERVEVHPAERVLGRNERQQLTVFARYTDGSVEDVTPMAQYETNVEEVATVSASGVVSTLDLAGDAAIMVRYQAQVAVFRATVPLGVEVRSTPPAKSFIDELVFKKLKVLGIPPSELSDDATFVRRVTVDIAGRLPSADEGRAFVQDPDPEKRGNLIDSLLASREHAEYFANKWSAVLRNKRKGDSYTRGTYAFYEWLRDSLHENLPYDEFVRSIVAASGTINEHPPVAWYRAVGTTEEQLEDTAQLFLGLRIQCARCHHHPFERWSQKDYYGFAAFFSRVEKKTGSDGLNDEKRVYHKRGTASARNPRSGEDVRPTGLGGAPLDLPPDRDPRLELAEWQRDPANPFFAPALVNRYWKHFFGRGLVEPEDDMRVTNPPTHPELLEALAKRFIESGFDLKDLVRTICSSSTYQLSSLPNEHNTRDQQNYSRYYPKRLNAEVLYDGVDQLTGASSSFPGLPPGTRAVALPDTGANNYFLTVFGRPMADSSCECERSQDANLAQSLHLMNSSQIHEKISSGNGRAARLAAEKERSDAEKIAELYQWAFARGPEAEEVEIALAHLGKVADRKQGYEDVVWALMNTKEFLFNH